MIGEKLDKNKLPYYTVLFKQFPDAITELVKCSKVGHSKYEMMDFDWMNFKRVENKTRYLDAALRHLVESKGQLLEVEDNTSDIKLLHLSASIWNLMAYLQISLELNDTEKNKN